MGADTFVYIFILAVLFIIFVVDLCNKMRIATNIFLLSFYAALMGGFAILIGCSIK